jgi:hypothetical protein
MLAFIGHLAAIGSPTEEFASLLHCFVIGAFSSVVASGMVYLSQRANSVWVARDISRKRAERDRDNSAATLRKSARRWWIVVHFFITLAIILASFALLCFGYGCWSGYDAFKALPSARVL